MLPRVSRALFANALFVMASLANADEPLRVSRLVNHTHLEFSAPSGAPPLGTRLIVSSLAADGQRRVTGYAIVRTEREAELISHSKNGMVLVGDTLEPVDLTRDAPNLPGRADLLVTQERSVSARYKPIVSQGVDAGPTAATLQGGEFMIGLGNSGYGLSDSFMVTTSLLADALGVPNLVAKARLWQSEDFRLAAAAGLIHAGRIKATAGQFGVLLDSQSNSRFISHSMFGVEGANTDANPYSGAAAQLQVGTRVQSGYECILNNWDRILVSPVYNFDSKSVGGYASYLFIWDHFHLSLGIASQDLTKLRFSTAGYLPRVDFYWRF